MHWLYCRWRRSPAAKAAVHGRPRGGIRSTPSPRTTTSNSSVARAGPAFDARQHVAQQLRQRHDRQPVLAVQQQHSLRLRHRAESLWGSSYGTAPANPTTSGAGRVRRARTRHYPGSYNYATARRRNPLSVRLSGRTPTIRTAVAAIGTYPSTSRTSTAVQRQQLPVPASTRRPAMAPAQRPATAPSTTPGYGSSTTPSYGSGTTPSYGTGTTPGYGTGTTPGYGTPHDAELWTAAEPRTTARRDARTTVPARHPATVPAQHRATAAAPATARRTAPATARARRRATAPAPRRATVPRPRAAARARAPAGHDQFYSNPARSASATGSDDRYGNDRTVRPPEQLPRRRRPTRLPTLAARPAACRKRLAPEQQSPICLPPVPCYSQPASAPPPTPNATSPYPSSGAAPPASSDSGEPAYRPGSTRTSGDSRRGTSAACRRRRWAAIPAVRESFPRATRKPPTPATDRPSKISTDQRCRGQESRRRLFVS